MINPTINDYIVDLLNENKRLFAFNEQARYRIKEIKKERDTLEMSAHTEEEIARVLKLTASLVGLYCVIRLNTKDIRQNLEKVKGLRNGIIKEI